MNKIKFGIVQGRLTQTNINVLQKFPDENWVHEFYIANSLDFSFIELLVEREHNSKNPFWSNDGRKKIKEIYSSKILDNYSICNDFIINHSLKNEETLTQIDTFLNNSSEINCKNLILPLLEKSLINEQNYKSYISIVKSIAQKAKILNLNIIIESLLEAKYLKSFVEEVDENNVSVVFDTGNRVIESHNLVDEILFLKKYISHVHIKDKNIEGENVILTTGLVDFKEVITALNKINYSGPFVFETTRGYNPIETAKFNISLIKYIINNISK